MGVMTSKQIIWLTSFCVLFLLGCGPNREQKLAEERRYESAQKAKVARQMAAPIERNRHKVGANELVVIEVPTVEAPLANHVRQTTCFVWRDAEFKTASLQCVAGNTDWSGPDVNPE